MARTHAHGEGWRITQARNHRWATRGSSCASVAGCPPLYRTFDVFLFDLRHVLFGYLVDPLLDVRRSGAAASRQGQGRHDEDGK